MKLKLSLKTKLIGAYILVALVSVIMTSMLARVIIDKRFQDYVKENLGNTNSQVLNAVKRSYSQDQQWVTGQLDYIGLWALQQGLLSVNILDYNGATVWSTKASYGEQYDSLISDFKTLLKQNYPTITPKYIEQQQPIIVSGRQVGTLIIGYYTPMHFSPTELTFINRLNMLFIYCGIASLMFALATGLYMAGRLSKPMLKAVQSTEMISSGYYNDRVIDNSNTLEISRLADSVNSLASSLETQQDLRKKMTSDIAHDLRTPLTTLQGHLEAMIDGLWEPSPERLKVCHEEITRLTRLIGDLENLAKMESQKVVLSVRDFNLADLVKRISDSFESELYSKKLKLILRLKKTVLKADSDKISRIIYNLLSNAIKYTQAGGEITAETYVEDDTAVLKVADNGAGISAEDQKYIFERLYRTDKSRNSGTGGSGIGLAIAKAIVQAHHGLIYVESEPGKGSLFTVKIPLINPESAAQTGSGGRTNQSASGVS